MTKRWCDEGLVSWALVVAKKKKNSRYAQGAPWEPVLGVHTQGAHGMEHVDALSEGEENVRTWQLIRDSREARAL